MSNQTCVCVGPVIVWHKWIRRIEWESYALYADGKDVWSRIFRREENALWFACRWARSNAVADVQLIADGKPVRQINAAHWLAAFEPKWDEAVKI